MDFQFKGVSMLTDQAASAGIYVADLGEGWLQRHKAELSAMAQRIAAQGDRRLIENSHFVLRTFTLTPIQHVLRLGGLPAERSL